MKKHKIITQDRKIYDALNNLKHESEVSIDKPVNYRAIDIILKSSNNNLIAISNGESLILKKIKDFNFDVYLKRAWR